MCLTIEVLTSEVLCFSVTQKHITMYPLLQVLMVNRVLTDINEFYNDMHVLFSSTGNKQNILQQQHLAGLYNLSL